MVKSEILEFRSWNLGLGTWDLELGTWVFILRIRDLEFQQAGYFTFLLAISPAASSAVSTGARQNVPEQM
jgi:hypothetical protein